MSTLDELSARIAESERRLAERDAAGYETPQAARYRLAHARTEWANGRRASLGDEQPFVETIMRDLDRFDAILHAQHAADVGPPDPDETPCPDGWAGCKCGGPQC